jgi:hypothetical protein
VAGSHTAPVTPIDVIPAPAADAVAFRLRRSRLILAITLTLAPVMLLMHGVPLVTTAVRTGHPPDALDVEVAVASVATIPLVVGLMVALILGRHLPWVRASAAGLEFAATRQVPAFLPWSAVQSVRLRFSGLFTQLVITPTDPDALTRAPVQGRSPRLRRRFGTPAGAHLVDVGWMTPRPTDLLTELNRRLSERGEAPPIPMNAVR